jgi:hypothetical protein
MGGEGNAGNPGGNQSGGVEIRRGKRSAVLRVDFYYKGVKRDFRSFSE